MLRWFAEVLLCDWKNFHELKQTYNSTDAIGNDRFVFNVGGNKYRIVAMIHFNKRTVYLRFVGTHREYNRIDCSVI